MKTYSNNKIHKVSYFSPEVFWSLKGDSSNQNKLRIIYLFIYCLCFLVDCFILSKFFLFNFIFARVSCVLEENGRPIETPLHPFCTEKQTKKKKDETNQTASSNNGLLIPFK